MALFTMLLEYKGGTYISQVRAKSPSAALKTWCADFRIAGLTVARKKELVRGLVEDEPTSISEMTGAWCVSATCGRELALMNIVQTADEKQVPRLRREARLRSDDRRGS